ncbi:MAG: substrate-binding domain-containing protein, partial [Treponema sp.]|nr:substrate-binding domain-containing protein [Treponema sp.]
MRKVLGAALVLLVVCSITVFAAGKSDSGTIKIAMMPKFKGENYFDAVKIGAQECVDELNKSGKVVDFLYDGPPQDQATNQRQVDILEGWIAQKVNVILVSPNDPNAIAPTLKKAQDRGIKVLTFDADAREDARDLFINQAVADGIAEGLVRGASDNLKLKGYGPDKPVSLGIVSSARTDANQQAWVAAIKALLAKPEYNWIRIRNEETDIYYPGPDETTTQSMAGTLIGRMGPNPDQVQVAMGITSMAGPALGSQY